MRALALAVLLTLAWLGLAPPLASAHEAAMSVVQLTELERGRFTLRWLIQPIEGGTPSQPIFPANCAYTHPVVDCGAGGLDGEIGFNGLGSRQSAAVLRLRWLDGRTEVMTFTATQPTAMVHGGLREAGFLRQVKAYVSIGFEHILLGVDHLLFVLGLIWLVPNRRGLVWTITAFTVAHSLTLAAVTFGLVGVPERLVNPLIALSIVFVGVEILKARGGEAGFSARYPWVVAFAFGLLHGMGFATALTRLGLPDDALLLGLLGFNVGVELGQLTFVAVVLALGWALRALDLRLPRWGGAVPAYLIGTVAAFWFVGRVAMLLAI